jgi:hypothetical protein
VNETNSPMGERYIELMEERLEKVQAGEDAPTLLDKIMMVPLTPILLPLTLLFLFTILNRKDLEDTYVLDCKISEARGRKPGWLNRFIGWRIHRGGDA